MQYKREPLTRDEASKLINACQTPREKVLILTMLDTGMRVSEVSHLTKENMDWQMHRMTIIGKGKKRRILPLTERLQSILENYLMANDRIGVDPTTIWREVKRVANRAGIRRKCSPHVLRHTFAVIALQKGVSIGALMNLLGHSDLQTTAKYLNLSPEMTLEEFKEKW